MNKVSIVFFLLICGPLFLSSCNVDRSDPSIENYWEAQTAKGCYMSDVQEYPPGLFFHTVKQQLICPGDENYNALKARQSKDDHEKK